jgi:hypothetical protein
MTGFMLLCCEVPDRYETVLLNKAGKELFPRYHHGSAALTAVASTNSNAYSTVMPRQGIWELRKQLPLSF